MESRPYPITEAVREQRRNAATKNGGQSEYRILQTARAHKRRLMRQMGRRIGDFDGLAVALIDSWARGFAKVTILDQFYAEHGLIRDGQVDQSLKVYFVDQSLKVYFTGLNSSRIAIERLERRLKQGLDLSLQQ